MIKTRKGNFIERLCCVSCDWFEVGCSIPIGICPECGDDIKEKRGRYIFEVKEPLFLMGGYTKIVGFERRVTKAEG